MTCLVKKAAYFGNLPTSLLQFVICHIWFSHHLRLTVLSCLLICSLSSLNLIAKKTRESGIWSMLAVSRSSYSTLSFFSFPSSKLGSPFHTHYTDSWSAGLILVLSNLSQNHPSGFAFLSCSREVICKYQLKIYYDSYKETWKFHICRHIWVLN